MSIGDHASGTSLELVCHDNVVVVLKIELAVEMNQAIGGQEWDELTSHRERLSRPV